MREILKNVHLEDGYPGVQLGALELEKGVIMIDAPPRPDDSREWLATLRGMGANQDRLLINLDSHPDRTLGVRNMETTALAHSETLKLFNKRERTNDNAVMHAVVEKMTALEMAAVAEYLSGK